MSGLNTKKSGFLVISVIRYSHSILIFGDTFGLYMKELSILAIYVIFKLPKRILFRTTLSLNIKALKARSLLLLLRDFFLAINVIISLHGRAILFCTLGLNMRASGIRAISVITKRQQRAVFRHI